MLTNWQDTLDYSNHPTWPNLLYGVAFLHNSVQERKKFGAIGWNVAYEFNRADFTASCQFIMNHLGSSNNQQSLALQFIIIFYKNLLNQA